MVWWDGIGLYAFVFVKHFLANFKSLKLSIISVIVVICFGRPVEVVGAVAH